MSARKRGDRPNVIFLMTDQQRADTVAPGSLCQTPVLDRLRQRGVTFNRCYAPNPICSPVRASLMTGMLPHTHGMVDCTHTVPPYRARLDTSLPFWSSGLRGAGYRTGYFGKWHIERSNRLEDFGFDDYELLDYFVDVHHKAQSQRYLDYRRRLGLDPEQMRLATRGVVRQEGYREMTLYGVTDEPVESMREYYIYERGIEFLRQAADNPDQPFLLFLSTGAPHDPYVVPRPFHELYDPASIPRPPNYADDLGDRPAIYRRLQSVWADLTWEDIAEATAHYYALCSLIDAQVGRLLASVNELGLGENTIVVFCSDHGDFMGAHRLFTKGVPPFEEAYRVPLIMVGPGIARGVAIDHITSLLDVAATMTALTIGETFDSQGRSLLPLLNGSLSDWRDEAYAEMHGQRFFYTQRIVWQDNYKYVFNGMDQDELYDLAADPGEMRNLAADPAHANVLKRMARRMWEIARETNDYNLYKAEDAMYRFAPVGPRWTE